MALHLSCVQTCNYFEDFENDSTAPYCDRDLPSAALSGSDHDSGPPANPLLSPALDILLGHGHGLQDTSDYPHTDLGNCYVRYDHMTGILGRFDVGQHNLPDCPVGCAGLGMSVE